MKIRKVRDVVSEIRRVQRESGMTDEKIAFYGNLSKSTVSDLLSGKAEEFTFKTLLKVAKAMDCELEVELRKKS